MSDPFYRLASYIQEFIYRQQWQELYALQGQAIEAILDSQDHLLLSGGTASGKTEAVFFPILTQLEHQPATSVQVLYIAPLKALINDQFRRLNHLLEESHMKVWRWHGDAERAARQQLLQQPCGVLQITPESLEALLMRRASAVSHLFSGLRFVIIDEVHAFMGSDRGAQLLCQLARIERLAACAPRRVGLSATISDDDSVCAWLGSGSEVPVRFLSDQASRRVRLGVEYFDTERADYYPWLYDRTAGRKCIVFTNSRSIAEETITHLRQYAAERCEPDIYRVHHGSISKLLRQEIEEALKESNDPLVTAATTTLELGIDIGDLERVLQLGAPYSCSSFVQRLGRSGRRSGVAEILFACRDWGYGSQLLTRAIPWDLLQSIAIIQLYAEEKWIEPAEIKPLPLSLLIQQSLSLLYAEGDLTPTQLAARIFDMPVFAHIDPSLYRDLLRQLLEREYLQRTDEGTLLIGTRAEGMVNHFSFYATFPDEQEFLVFYGNQELGSIAALPPLGVCIALAGRNWMVQELDAEHRRITVVPAKGSSVPTWSGTFARIHSRVLQRMRSVLAEETLYPYLSSAAQDKVRQVRMLVRQTGLLANDAVAVGEGTVLFIPWQGSRAISTWRHLLQMRIVRREAAIREVAGESLFGFLIGTELAPERLLQALSRVILGIPSLSEALHGSISPQSLPYIDKYDHLLDDDLRVTQYLANELCLDEIQDYLRPWR